MNQELILKKCFTCGATIKVIKDCTCSECEITCCGKPMQKLKANSEDAAFEKHVPMYEIEKDKLKVHVNHVMEEEHFIEWICFKTDYKEEYVYLKPNMQAEATFAYDNGTLYAFCNKHGLWSTKIEK